MNKFEKNRIRLDALMEILKSEGMTIELEKEFEELCSETAIAVLLGPNESINRNDGKENREYPDSQDLWYYNDTFSNVDYRPFFTDSSLGDVELEYFVREIQGIEIPILRITYEKKWLFFNALVDEKKKNEIDLKIKFLSSILACRWYEARMEVVRL